MQLAALWLARGPVELQWRAPVECPDGDAIAARIDGLLGEIDSAAAPAQAIVDVRAEPDGRYAAIVQLGGAAGGGVRTFSGESCASVADAIALVVAVHVDALAVGEATALGERLHEPQVESPDRRRPIEPGSATSVSRTVDVAPERSTPTRPRRWPVRGALRVGAAASFGALPQVATPVVTLGGALMIGRARVQLDLGWQLTRRTRLSAPDDDAGADITLYAGALRGGWVPRVRTIEFPLLGGVELGVMTARGFGLAANEHTQGPWVALLAGAGLAWTPVPAFALVLDPALVIGLGRQQFVVDAGEGQRKLHRPRTVGGRIGLALEVRLP